MNQHAPLSPSSASRLVACPGSRIMAERYPQEETIESREGDAVHWAGAELLRGNPVAVGATASNGVLLTAEMLDTATQYSQHIITRHGVAGVGINGRIEKLQTKSPLHTQNYGTPDFSLYNSVLHHLYIDDEKNGHGFVSEYQNWQLINYVALVAYYEGQYADNSLKVTMTIHQPRAYHRRGVHRSVTTTLGAMRGQFEVLKVAFDRAMQPDAPVIASDPQECMNCPGRVHCEAAIAAGYVGVDLAYSSVPLVMSPAALSKEYRTLVRAEKAIKARREGIAESIKATIRRGQAVPYFGMQHTQGRVVWQDEAVTNGLVEVGQAYSVNVQKPSFITPRQAIIAGIPEEVVSLYSTQTHGSAELVEEDGNEAKRIFQED